MKSFCLILFLIVTGFANLHAQHTFQRTYPFTNPEIPVNFVATPDSNFLVYSTSYDCIFLMKINQWGDTLWTRRIILSYFDIHELITLHDSGFIVTGSWNNSAAVLKINQYGDSLWMQQFFSQLNGIGLSIIETDDHGFYMLNSHDDTDIVYYDVQFMRLDSMGNLIWEKSYNIGHDIINLGYLIKLSDSSYLAQVRRHMGGPSSPYGRLMHVDTSGNMLGFSGTAEPGREGGDFIAKTIDSNYFMIGNARAHWDDDPYGILYKLDSSGYVSGYILFPGSSAMNSVAADFAGGCMVACDSFQLPNRKEFQLKRFDSNSQLISSNLYPIDHRETANAIHTTPDGGFMAVGYHQLSSGQIETYIVKTDSTGQLNSNGYEITESDSFLCEGDSITLSVQPATSYLWSDGQTTQTITVTQNGSYNVSVVDSLGDTYYTTYTQVIFLETPVPILGNDITLCNGESILLDPGSFSSYVWQDSSTSSTYNVTSSGIFSVLVTAANGCSNSDTIEVSIFPQPVLYLGNDTSACTGALVVLHAGFGFTNYEWQDSSGDSVLIVSTTGNYSVTVVDTNGCSESDEILVTFNPLPQVSLGNDTTLCITQTIVLDAGANFSSYYWQDGSSMEAILASSNIPDSISYSVQVTDSNSCVGTDTIVVVFDLCQGISSANENRMLVSPNPFDKYIHLILPDEFNNSGSISIFNSTGEKISEEKILSDAFIDVSKLPEGIYFLLLKSDDKYLFEKVVKANTGQQ